MNSSNRMKLQVWLVILAVFGLGGVTGVSLDRMYLSRSGPRESHGARGFGGREPGRMATRMQADLNLSDEQVEAVRKVFEDSRKEFSLADCPGFKEARQRTHDRINALLKPDQQQRYAEITRQRAERWEERKKQEKQDLAPH